MKNFISRYRFCLQSVAVFLLVVLLAAFFLFPWARSVGTDFATTLSELKVSRSMPSEVKMSADSLAKSYAALSARIDQFSEVKVNSSGILKMLLDAARREGVVLVDLSTRDGVADDLREEYPVSFNARGGFVPLLKFVAFLENGPFCIHVSSVKMTREDNGNLVSHVELSVLAKTGEARQ
ncbi:MAG: hypothetical protein WCR04_10155 [Fibrobacteraceae bacterium]